MRPASCRTAKRKGRRSLESQTFIFLDFCLPFFLSSTFLAFVLFKCFLVPSTIHSSVLAYDFDLVAHFSYVFARTQKLISNLYRVFFQEKGHPSRPQRNALSRPILPSNRDHLARKLPPSPRNLISRKTSFECGSAISGRNKRE
jgi:hypothetical protein